MARKNIQFLLASFLIVFFVGVIDDLLTLSPIKKLIGQIIAILIIIFLGKLEKCLIPLKIWTNSRRGYSSRLQFHRLRFTYFIFCG